MSKSIAYNYARHILSAQKICRVLLFLLVSHYHLRCSFPSVVRVCPHPPPQPVSSLRITLAGLKC